MAEKNENSKPRDERFDKAESFARQYELSDTLKDICDIFIDNYVNHIKQYYSVAPIGKPIYYESYICAFTKKINDEFSCYALVFGNKVYRESSRVLSELQTEDDVFGKTYSMFKYIKRNINIIFELLYNRDKPRFSGEENIQNFSFNKDDESPNVSALKVTYCFRYQANNRVDPFSVDIKPV